MRIAFCAANYEGSGYHRIVAPALALRDCCGHEIAFVENSTDSAFAAADVVVLQRQTNLGVLPVIKAAKARGQRVLHEIDDLMHAPPSWAPEAKNLGSGRPAVAAFDRISAACDGLIVSTVDLAHEYRHKAPTIAVAENGIEDHIALQFEPPCNGEPRREGEIRLGYAGAPNHGGDFAVVARSIERVLRAREHVKFVMVGGDLRPLIARELWKRSEYWGGTGSKWPLRASDIGPLLPSVRWYQHVDRVELDVGIAPLAPLTFNRCKSALRLMEYGALGIPVVASRFGPFVRYERESPKSVWLAGDEREWETALLRMIDDVGTRAMYARENRDAVLHRHLTSVTVEQWDRAIRQPAQSAACAAV
jgi:hypothetical protein